MRDRDLAIIRFVTARQHELRGLHATVFGVWMLAVLSVGIWMPMPRGSALKLAFFVGNATLPSLAQTGLSGWYGRRFGRVSPPTFPRPFIPWMLLGLGWRLT